MPVNEGAVAEGTPSETDAGTGSTTTVVVEQPEPPDTDRTGELAAIAAKITGLETRVATALEERETWQTTTITSLQQEIADLKATLQAMTESLPQQMQAFKDELTRLLQEQQAALTVVVPPEAPEIPAEIPAETPPEIPPQDADPDAPREAERQPIVKKQKRVI